jgi:aminopeptidase N
MEHQTMTTLSNFNFSLVAHELGHMWFGDYVTCATWMDIWINEGFASYTEYLAYQNIHTQEDADSWMYNAQTRALNEPVGSVYVPFDQINNVGRIFSGNLSYKKGATLLHMIRNELDNDTIFFQTLRNFLYQFGDSVATGLDFCEVLETTSGEDFSDFFEQWYFGQGYPIFNFSWSQAGDNLKIRSVQSTSSAATPLFKTSIDFLLTYAGGDTLVRAYQNQNTQDFLFNIPYQVASISVDPEGWLLKKVNGISHVPDHRIENSQLFMIWPNPAGNRINIRFRNIGYDHLILITDLAGNVIRNYKTSEAETQIPLTFLPPGVYLIRVDEYGKQSVRKFVKNR